MAGKYNAKRVTIDGHTFPSQREAVRYSELKLLERSGEITHLELQPRFDLTINGVNCGFWKADFRYFTRPTNTKRGEYIVEDVKSTGTAKEPIHRLKVKLVEALYPGVKVTEIIRGRKWIPRNTRLRG
jgi:hypothetical protein